MYEDLYMPEDDGDDGTDATGRTDDTYGSKTSNTTLGSIFHCPNVSSTERSFQTPAVESRWIAASTDREIPLGAGFTPKEQFV